MMPDRFARLKQAFTDAWGLPNCARQEFLNKRCADDPDLRDDVADLLERSDSLPDVLKSGAVEDILRRCLQTQDENQPLQPLPREIGGYNIRRVLGEGGMGIVYEAEQRNPRRLVALKVIRTGPFVSDHQVKMFKREEIALAKLKHPGIAGIYEAGRTEEGRHFFVMELVDGIPLQQYLGQVSERADLEFRLRLFLRICAAITYAHQCGIIHRDLKPSNVLVCPPGQDDIPGGCPPEPQIKVLDFGLAKITDADVTLVSLASDAAKIQGTLAYMSPEQASGGLQAVDIRTDVYALGVILYEMLTGKRPYDLHPILIPQAVRTICEEEPVRPSTIVRTVRGDLETIVLKALEKDRDDRYQSVSALAEDVERFLENQPIIARPPTTTYYLRKLIGRNKTASAAVVVGLALIITVAVAMSVMYRAQKREQVRAQAEARKAERINDFLLRMLASPDPWVASRDVTVREVLEAEAVKVDGELADDPEVKAAVLTMIGNTYLGLGLFEQAETYMRAGLDAERQIYGERHLNVAASLDHLGELMLRRGRLAEAESVASQTLAMRRDILGSEDANVAASLNLLATVLNAEGRWSEATLLYREALSIRRKALGSNHRDVGASLNDLAVNLWALDRYAEAEPLYREALAIFTNLYGPDHPDVATMTDNLAILLDYQGRPEEAEPLHRQAIAVKRILLGDEHPQIGVALANLGTCLEMKGRLADAESLFRESASNLSAAHGDTHPQVALALDNLAHALHLQGRLDEAESCYREALRIHQQTEEDQHPALNWTREHLATVLIDRRRPREAEPLLCYAMEMLQKRLDPDHWRHADACCRLAWCFAAQGRDSEADSLLHTSCNGALAIPNARWRSDVLLRNAAVYKAWGKTDEAQVYLARANQPANKR